MTIIVMGHLRAGPGEGARMRDTLVAHMAASTAEDGCEFYNFAFDAADPDLIRISERWASAEALAVHSTADHQKAFGRALRDFGVTDVSVKAWDGEYWRTLIDE